MSDDSDTFTQEDIDSVNGSTNRRAAQIAYVVGAGLVVVGIVGAIAWVWIAIRQQVRIADGGSFSFSQDGTADLGDRIDVFATTLGLLLEAALVLSAGVAIRVLSGVFLAREGVSLTRLTVGDPFPGAPEE